MQLSEISTIIEGCVAVIEAMEEESADPRLYVLGSALGACAEAVDAIEDAQDGRPDGRIYTPRDRTHQKRTKADRASQLPGKMGTRNF